MKTKQVQWYDCNEAQIKFGIAVYYHGSWANVSTDGVPLLFDSKEECDVKRKEISKMKEK